MNILVLNGSPKGEKSDTSKLTRAFLEGMGEEAKWVYAYEEDIKPCLGCFSSSGIKILTGGAVDDVAFVRGQEDGLVEHLDGSVDRSRFLCRLGDGHVDIIRGDVGHVPITQRCDDVVLDLRGVVGKGSRPDVGCLHNEPFFCILPDGGIIPAEHGFLNLPLGFPDLPGQLVRILGVKGDILAVAVLDSLPVLVPARYPFVGWFLWAGHIASFSACALHLPVL